MSEERQSAEGDPINAFFREVLLIGGGATRLYLVRHAQSQGNTGEDLVSGDPDLTDVGREQARRLGERMRSQRVDVIYSSPLRRTQQTALVIAGVLGLEVFPRADLREIDLGQDNADVRLLPPEERGRVTKRILVEGTWDSFPGSEGSRAARRRVRAAMDDIVRRHPGHRVVVVTHSGFIQTYVSLVLGLKRDFVFYPFNASITSIRAQGERRVIWRLNDVAHLGGMPAGYGGIS
mgnify:CR=1 FL=1